MTSFNRMRRAFAAALLTIFAAGASTALAAAPENSVNAGYDLEIVSDWTAGPDEATIVPAGEQLLLAASWHNGRPDADDSAPWIPNSSIQYTWRSANEQLISGFEAIPSWYDPEPDWDPAEQVSGGFAAAEVSTENIGATQVTCTAQAASPYQLTGNTQASAQIVVAGLKAASVGEQTQLGQTIRLDAFWTPDDQYTKDQAREYFSKQTQTAELWNGSEDEWVVSSFVTMLGTEVTGADAIASASGPITSEDSGGFGCSASVTPQQAGTYVFSCVPAFGSGVVDVQVTVVPLPGAPLVAEAFPASQEVYVPALAEEDLLRQRFSVEVAPGYADDGSEVDGTVFWSIQKQGSDPAFIEEENGAMSAKEALDLELQNDLFEGSPSALLRAWIVPDFVKPEPKSILEYGEEHPESVHKWELVLKEAPVLAMVPDSPLKSEEAGGEMLLTGLIADVEGQNPVQAVLSDFVWNAGSATEIRRGNDELGDDESVGTGDQLRIDFPNTAISSIYAVFVVQGDVTGSGTVSITDLVRMARALSGTEPLDGIYLRAADFTGTGSISVSDLVREAALLRGAHKPV